MKDWLQRLNQFEPARLRAFWIALIALLATLGITVSADVDAKVTAIIGMLAVILPWIQGETTRGAVYAPATVEQIKKDLTPTAVVVDPANDTDDDVIPADEYNDEDPVVESDYGDAGPVDVPPPPDTATQNEEG